MQITETLFVAYCQCPYKAFLNSKVEVGQVIDYEVIQTEADATFRDEATKRLLRSHTEAQVSREPPSLRLAVKEGARLILGAKVEARDVALTRGLLERLVDRDDKPEVFVLVTFSLRNKLTREDSLVAAFQGIILVEALGQPVPFVKVVHGPDFSVSKIKLVGPTGTPRLVREARQCLDRLRTQIQSSSPPLMRTLGSHELVRGAKGVPRCGRGVGITPRKSRLTSVSPRNNPVV